MKTWRQKAWVVFGGSLLVLGFAQAQGVPAVAETVSRATHVCEACHGHGGRSETKTTPSLAGQSKTYLAAQLRDFRGQVRAEPGTQGYMWGISALLDDATIAGLADHYAAQAPVPGKQGNAALMRQGSRIFAEGIPSRGVRACASCHGAKGAGDEKYPRLAGQRADYLVSQLRVFRTVLRPHAELMRNEVRALKPEEMRAVAEYAQSL